MTVRERNIVALWLGWELSVSVTENGNVPTVVGVPLKTPVEAPIVTPGGKFFALQVYGAVPPVAVKVALYTPPAAPIGSELVVIERPGLLISSANPAVAV